MHYHETVAFQVVLPCCIALRQSQPPLRKTKKKKKNRLQHTFHADVSLRDQNLFVTRARCTQRWRTSARPPIPSPAYQPDVLCRETTALLIKIMPATSLLHRVSSGRDTNRSSQAYVILIECSAHLHPPPPPPNSSCHRSSCLSLP